MLLNIYHLLKFIEIYNHLLKFLKNWKIINIQRNLRL